MQYTVTVFDKENQRIYTESFDAEDEISADGRAYAICYSTTNGNSYDVAIN
jgi:hypothetical protein